LAGCCQSKQGIPIDTGHPQAHTNSAKLVTGQNPIVSTSFVELLAHKLHKDPGEIVSGVNVTVGIVAIGGNSQEDAIIINKGAIDRGLGRSTCHCA
jgi:DNA-directed RNA polymerase beta subunit